MDLFVTKAAVSFLALYVIFRLVLLFMTETNLWMWIVFFLEVASYGQILPFQILRIFALKAETCSMQPGQQARRLVGNQVPLVDLFIPCCGEPIEIISETVRGACLLNYPQDRFQVRVLDDGNSPSLLEAVEKLRTKWPNLHYHTRGMKKGYSTFAKASNLNHVLFDASDDPFPEFITVLDSDFIPSPDLLRAGLAHLVTDPKLAIVGTSQIYYNLPVGDPLYQGLEWFSAVLTPQLTALRGAVASGSGCLIRRDPLVAVGGFPVLTSGEDMILSYTLLASGYDIISLAEPLQYGRVPEGIQGHIFQRKRWSISLAERIMAWNDSLRNLIPRSRRTSMVIEGMIHILILFSRTLEFVVLPLALFTGRQLVPAPSLWVLKSHVSMATIYLSILYISQYIQALRVEFKVSLFPHLEEAWMAPGQLLAIIRFFLFKAKSTRSLVTGSSDHPWNQGISSQPGGLVGLTKRMIPNPELHINALSLIATIGAMCYNLVVKFRCSNAENDKSVVAPLLTAGAWPPILHLSYNMIAAHLVPLAACLRLPQYPEMRAALGPHPHDPTALFPTKEIQDMLKNAKRPYLGYGGHFLVIPVILAGLLVVIILL